MIGNNRKLSRLKMLTTKAKVVSSLRPFLFTAHAAATVNAPCDLRPSIEIDSENTLGNFSAHSKLVTSADN